MKDLFFKYKNLPTAAKAAAWFVFASMLQKGMAFITVPIFTRVMDTVQYGTYSTYLSWTSITTVVLTMRLETGAYANLLGKEKSNEQKMHITMSFISLCFCITSLALFLLLLFPKFFVNVTELPFSMLVLMLLEIYFIPVVNYWVFQQRFEYKYRCMVAYIIIKSLFNVLMGLFLVCFLPIDLQAYGRVISVVSIECVMGIFLYVSYVRKTHIFFTTKSWKPTLKFQLPLVPHYLSMNILFSSDRIMISKLIGKAEAGIYNVAYSVGQIMDILKMCIIDTVRPWFYEKMNSREYNEIRKMSTVLISGMTLVSILYTSVAPELVRIFAPERYYTAIYVIPPVAMSSIFTFKYHFLMIIETYYAKTTKIMKASITAAITNIGLNYIFIPQLGFVVAGYTTLISYIILSEFHCLTIRQIEKNELDGEKIFENKLINFISIGGIVGCLGVSYLYKYIFVRYFFVLISMFAIFFARKKIILYYKNLRLKK